MRLGEGRERQSSWRLPWDLVTEVLSFIQNYLMTLKKQEFLYAFPLEFLVIILNQRIFFY